MQLSTLILNVIGVCDSYHLNTQNYYFAKLLVDIKIVFATTLNTFAWFNMNNEHNN